MFANQITNLKEGLHSNSITTRSEITCEGLDLFMKSSKQLLANMEILSHDLELIKSGKKIIFALDFSEIFMFIYPEKSDLQNRQTAQLLLNSENLKFTLLPGTTIELVKALNRLIFDNKQLQNQVTDLLKKPIVNALLSFFSKNQLDDDFDFITRPFSTVKSGLIQINQLKKILQRLTYLKEAPNFVSLDEIFDQEDNSIKPNLDILHRCQSSFNLYRQGGRDFNNFIDSHNYALAWSLSEKHIEKKDTIYMIVTSSPATFKVYRNLKWDELRFKANNPSLPSTSLVRHPIQTLYLSKILANNIDGSKHLKQIISSLNFLIKEFGKLKSYKDYSKGEIASDRLVKLPRNKKYIDSFMRFRDSYTQLFTEIRYAIETDLITEENFRWEKGVNPWAIDGRISASFAEPVHLVSTRVLFKLFDQITNLTLEIISKNKNALENIPKDILREVDIEGVVIPPIKLEIHTSKNQIFNCKEIIVKKGSQTFLAGDVYRNYYAIWWQSAVSFAEFLDAIRIFIASLPKNSGKVNHRKLFNGIYIFLHDSREPLVLPIEQISALSAEDIKDFTSEKRIQMIRIADYWGDVCYDFEQFRSVPQRIGVVSHTKNFNQLSWFIYRTNLKRTALTEWNRVVSESLNFNSKKENQTINEEDYL